MLLGSHVSMSGKEMLLGSAETAFNWGENTFMIYTGAPQNTRRKAIADMKIPEGKAFMVDHDLSHLIVHAPYIINLGNTIKPENFAFAVDFMRAEIKRCDALGANQMTFHPGAHVGAGPAVAIKNISKGFNEIIDPKQNVQIAIETMAGKGTEVGRTFEEIAMMIEGTTHNEKLSVTLDTCHTSDAGYDIKNDFDGVLNEFDKIIGLDRLKVLHINDSKNPQGAHKDRHANFGFGELGFEALMKVVNHPQLTEVPKILETPYVGPDKNHMVAPYPYELAMIKSGKFYPDLLTDIENQVPIDTIF